MNVSSVSLRAQTCASPRSAKICKTYAMDNFSIICYFHTEYPL